MLHMFFIKTHADMFILFYTMYIYIYTFKKNILFIAYYICVLFYIYFLVYIYNVYCIMYLFDLLVDILCVVNIYIYMSHG